MNSPRPISGYLGAVGLVIAASLVCETVRTYLVPTNMVMAYLLAVVVAAIWLGRRPAVLVAFLSVIAFDILFVPPRFTLRVSDSQYLVTFFALFVVGVVISSLIASIREKIQQVQTQQARTNSLYYLTRDLSAAADVPAIVTALRRAVSENFGARLTLVLDSDALSQGLTTDAGFDAPELQAEVVRWVFASGRKAGSGTSAFPEVSSLYFPVKGGSAVIGVLVIEGGTGVHTDNLQMLKAFAGQVAMALERVQFSRQAEEARVLVQKANLEQALLNSISHDLRTPLVTICGVLDALMHDDKMSIEKQRMMVATASDEAMRLNRFVGSLLDMTRIDAGALSLCVEGCDVEEIVGCVVAAVEQRAGSERIVTSVAPGMPVVLVDLALFTQALVNLLDNALKYSPPTAEVVLAARQQGEAVVFTVTDSGPGVPSGEEERIFEKFYRLEKPERRGGTGLGLSIAKGIVEAHCGAIKAANRREGGLVVEVTIPTGEGTE